MSFNLKIPVALPATSDKTGRSKVGLKPGHSLMDWIKFTHSGKDLTGFGGKCLDVSQQELSKHKTRHDAWIAIGGKVYNITHYLEYHPGGEDEIMRGAGRDATDIFNQVHRWVNVESMLQNCFVGILKRSWTVDGIQNEGNSKDNTINKTEWPVLHLPESYESGISINLKEIDEYILFVVNGPNIQLQGLVTDLIANQMFVKASYSPSYILNIKLPLAVKPEYKVEMVDEHCVNILCVPDKVKKENKSLISPKICWTVCEPKMEFFYWPCKLLHKIALNYNTVLVTFSFPSGTKMWIPVGYHVQFKSYIEGIEVARNYTPVTLSLFSNSADNEEVDGSKVVFIVKIYLMGVMTQLINNLNLGDDILISNYTGNFSDTLLRRCESVIMFAAGTGITPMINVIQWLINAKDKTRSLLLLFFNRTEEDIIWRNEFQNLEASYPQIKIIHILSEPNEKWLGVRGQLNEELFNQLMSSKPENKNEQFLVCGPLPFVKISLRCLECADIRTEAIYTFASS